MQTTFTAGQTVYSTDGRQGLYVAEVVGGHAVQPLFEDGDGVTEPLSFYAEGIDVWHSVHVEPPRPALDAEIAAQREKLDRLHMEVAALENARFQAKRDQREVIERLQQHEALRYLDDFLNATITHYVMKDEGQVVVMDSKAFNEARSGLGYNERVLTLYARVNDKGTALNWQLKTGNIGEREIFAFPDADKATAKAREIVAEALKDALRDVVRDKREYSAATVLKNTAALGMDPPTELLQALDALRRENAQQALAKAQADAAKAQETLARLPVAA